MINFHYSEAVSSCSQQFKDVFKTKTLSWFLETNKQTKTVERPYGK